MTCKGRLGLCIVPNEGEKFGLHFEKIIGSGGE